VPLASPPGPITIDGNLYKKLGFEPAKFEPVIVLGTVPNVLVVKPTCPAPTARELIADQQEPTPARSHSPGKATARPCI
jgi:tripartite-type tricarboxylate transporter receptor subunit TctC